MGRKLGGCAPLGEEELDPLVTQCRLGLTLLALASPQYRDFGHRFLRKSSRR